MKNKRKKHQVHPTSTLHAPKPHPAGLLLIRVFHKVRPHLLVILIGILAVLALTAGVVLMQRQREQKLAQGFAQVENARSADELIELSRDFQGTDVGATASFRLARQLYDEGDYDKAGSRFSLFLQQYPGNPMAEAAELGEAYALEAAGKYSQAEIQFDNIAKTAAALKVRLDALAGAGRCAKAQGKLAQAEDYFQRLLDSNLETAGFYQQTAEMALKNIRLLREKEDMSIPEEAAIKPEPEPEPAAASEAKPAASAQAAGLVE